jgi:CubicO group peptidase (beta-lactamase class C family)
MEKRMKKNMTGTGHTMKLIISCLTLTTVLGVLSPCMAVEPSSTKATGVISKQFSADSSNWDAAPMNMFSFTLTERIFPTLIISRGDGAAVAPLRYAPKQVDATELIVSDPATGRAMTADQLLDRRIQNNGLIVIHKGKIIHESYRNGLSRELRHLNFSTAKSFTGMLAQIALEKGFFKEDDLASKYVPELRGKEAWNDLTVRHVWDMRDGTKFVEDYEDDNSDVRVQDRATGWRPHGKNDPKGLRDFIKTSENLAVKINPTGEVFNYSSIQTEILGLIIQGASGKPLAEFFEENFWSKLGAEHDAGFGTDGYGQPIAQGALSMTLPDFARSAMLVLNKGKNHKGEQVVAASYFEDLVTPNQMLKDAFPEGFKFLAPNGNYRSQFWIVDAEKKQFMMIGVYGQLAYFDYENEFALITFGSYPIAKDPLLVDSLGTLIEAMQITVGIDQETLTPNLGLLKTIGR